MLPKFKIIIIFLLLVSYFLFLPPAFASSSVPPTTNVDSNVPDNLHNWTQTVMIEVASALTCQIAGIDPINPTQSCLGVDQKEGKIGFLQNAGLPDEALAKSGGAIGFVGNMIAVLYTPPLHSADYFQNLAQNFGLSKHAYAQTTGTGFDSLSPLMNLWSAFRNIVYLFLVIVFVAIGLAIMLRIKIDPRTVMTIQNQIPKIIVGILAVTFSFAIAGFLIDLMWVFIYIIYNLISGVAFSINPKTAIDTLNPTNMVGNNPFGALGGGNIFRIIWDSSVGISGVISALLGGDVGFFDGPFGWLANLFGHFIGFTGGAIAFVIIAIALLIALFRLWFTLLMAYISILLDVVLAPFWIIGSAIPGSPISFGGWLRDISANLLAFPATIAMFLLGRVFAEAFSSGASKDMFVPPLIGNPGNPSLIGSLIGLGIILMTPNVVNMLKSALKAPKTNLGGIGAALGAGTGVIKGTAGTTAAYYMKTPKLGEKQGVTGILQRIFR